MSNAAHRMESDFLMAGTLRLVEDRDDFEPPSDEFMFGRIGELPIIGPSFGSLPEKGVAIYPRYGGIVVIEPARDLESLDQHIFIPPYLDGAELSIDGAASLAMSVGHLAVDHPGRRTIRKYKSIWAAGGAYEPTPLGDFLDKRLGTCFEAALISKIAFDTVAEREGLDAESSIDWITNGGLHVFLRSQLVDRPGEYTNVDGYKDYDKSGESALKVYLNEGLGYTPKPVDIDA